MLLLPWLMGCTGADPTSQGVPQPEPTLWFADEDGDGFGDGDTSRELVEPEPGWVTEGTDCDDAHPGVYPGAPHACDGVSDNDCDGVDDPNEVDGDGDGFVACQECDDADPAVHPDALEVCDAAAADEDCDGLEGIDDPDHEPYSCGWCPDPEGLEAATAAFHTFTVNGCVLDPGIFNCDPALDTHEEGWRLHRVGYRTDIALRDELYLFLPPGPGAHNQNLNELAVYAGFRTISLGWNNEDKVSWCEQDAACYEQTRRELLFGVDESDTVDITPADSILGRLEALLDHLVSTDPQGGWDAYWDPAAGGVQWDRLVVAGWSVGAGEAAYMGKDLPLDGLVLLSGPKEAIAEGVQAPWLSEPRATPECAQIGAYHRFEDPRELLLLSFEAMGMPGPPVDVDVTPPPYGGAQVLVTEAADKQEDWCTWHQTMGMDDCMDIDALAPMYLYAFCEAAYRDSCP